MTASTGVNAQTDKLFHSETKLEIKKRKGLFRIKLQWFYRFVYILKIMYSFSSVEICFLKI